MYFQHIRISRQHFPNTISFTHRVSQSAEFWYMDETVVFVKGICIYSAYNKANKPSSLTVFEPCQHFCNCMNQNSLAHYALKQAINTTIKITQGKLLT